MRKLTILISLLVVFVSCASFNKLKKEINGLDDAIVTKIVDEIRLVLENIAETTEKNVIAEVKDNVETVKQVDNIILRKSIERIAPIVEKAMKTIEPALREAARDIKAQIREEILEELTGKEINEDCPDCPKKEKATIKDTITNADVAKEVIKEVIKKVEPIVKEKVKEKVTEVKKVIEEKPIEKKIIEEKPTKEKVVEEKTVK